MTDIRDPLYIPGLGYAGYLPGSDRPAVIWGDGFAELIKERAAQNAANKTERDPSPNSPGLYDPEALKNFDRRKLTQNELRELAAELGKKYDPTNMTEEELDSFMDDLVKEGVLSKYELGLLGYHGFMVVGSILDDGGLLGSTSADTSNPNWDTYFGRYGHAATLQQTGGNALAYVMLRLLWNKDPSGSEQFVKRVETQNSAFEAMAAILDAMRSRY